LAHVVEAVHLHRLVFQLWELASEPQAAYCALCSVRSRLPARVIA